MRYLRIFSLLLNVGVCGPVLFNRTFCNDGHVLYLCCPVGNTTYMLNTCNVSGTTKKPKFFWPRHETCGIFVPQPGIEPVPSAVKARSPNHWTAREFPEFCLKYI